jgi:hypothetical protein
VVGATNAYDALPDAEKAQIPLEVKDTMAAAQWQAGAVNKTDAEATLTGDVPWYVRLVVEPVLTDDARHAPFAEKLPSGKELIALFEIKLINTLTGAEVTLPAGQTVSIALKQSVADRKNVLLLREKADGTLERLTFAVDKNTVTFTASDFGLLGIAANAVAQKEAPGAINTPDVIDAQGNARNCFWWLWLLILSALMTLFPSLQ